MDWTSVVNHGTTALASGGASFLGAFLRFKQRLQVCESALSQLSKEVPQLVQQHAAAVARWRADLELFRFEVQRELKHRDELHALREKERAAHDPHEALKSELTQLRQEVERLKDRGSRYVRSDVFTEFTKAQEGQWKEMARTLGRLEGIIK